MEIEEIWIAGKSRGSAVNTCQVKFELMIQIPYRVTSGIDLLEWIS